MYSSMAHARQHLLSEKEPSSKAEQLSVISEDTLKVYTKSQGVTTIPSQSGKTIPVVLTDPITIVQGVVNMFNYSSSFLHKMNKHLEGDDPYTLVFSINELDQAVESIEGREFNILYFNPAPHELRISNNTFIGKLSPVTQVITAKTEPTTNTESEPNWLGNIPTNKLSSLDRGRRTKYIVEILKIYEATSGLKTRKDTTDLVVKLLLQNWHVFYRDGNPGYTSLIEHLIYTPKNAIPIKLKNRPINPGLIENLREQIQTWLHEGVIKSRGISPWNFPLLSVRKKNGKWQWVVDFRKLNNITRKDSFPIPNIVELHSYLQGSRFFTSLGLAVAFQSIPIREIDQEKLSFSALDQSYQFCRMPFGLTSAPNTWARLVIAVMQHIPKTKLIVFFDDLLIHSPTLEEHLRTLKTILTAVSQSGLRINLEKSDWIKTEVKFLGIITTDGVTVPPRILADHPRLAITANTKAAEILFRKM